VGRLVRAEDSSKTIRAVDGLLLPLGFKRRARSQEWSKSTGADREWVHLNFGKSVTIHPSFGVQYRDLLQAIPELPGPVDGTVRMLSSLFQPSRRYSSEDPPELLTSDIRDTALPGLAALRNRESVIEQLRASLASAWPVPSYSHRIRLLPLLLAGLGRVDEALDAATSFESESVGRDQIIPGYDVFLSVFRATLAV